MARHIPLLVLLTCAACSGGDPVAAPAENRTQRLAVLDRIASQCQVARSAFVLAGEDRLRVSLGREEDFEKVECVLREVDGLNLPAGNVDFIVDRSGANAANQAAPVTNEAAPATNQAAPAEGNNAQAD